MDTSAFVNHIPLSTLEVAEILESKILGFPIEVTRFEGRGEYMVGYLQLCLRVGPIAFLTCFHVVKIEVSYHIVLG